MKYDRERVGKIIADIKKYIKELKDYKIFKVEDLLDSKTFHASSMLVFSILNRIIDLGSEVISVEELGAPSSYGEIMPILAKAGIINSKDAEDINNLIKKRNVLAHFYGDITEKDLIFMINEIDKVEKLLVNVAKRIDTK